MAKPGKTKKQILKEPDEFISTTARIMAFLKAHRRGAAGVVIGVLVLILLGLFWRGHEKRMEAEAAEQYNQAYQQFRSAEEGLFAETGSKEGFENALKGFHRVASSFPRTRMAAMADLYRGHCLVQLERHGEAIEAYQKFLAKESRRSPLVPLALHSLALSHRAKGDYGESNRCLQRILESDPGDALRLSAMIEIGRNYELLKEPDKALKMYEEAIQRYSENRSLDLLKEKVLQLKKGPGR